MKETFLCAALLALSACASQPSADRSTVPDLAAAQRPDGVVPDGVTEVRDTLAAQRAETRAQENALNLRPNTLSATPAMPWYESVLSSVADVLQFIRNF